MVRNLIIFLIAAALLIIAAVLIRKWIKEKKKEALEKSGLDLANREGLSEGDAEKIIKKIKKENLTAEQKTVDGTPVIELAEAIHDSKGVFDDDEDKVYVTLGRLKSKASLSYLSDYFQKIYKVSLIAYLQTFLSAEELGKVNEILKKLK